tara:strand:- start:1252 stop:1944 length:693 start_codon:yes stop_codon:yes gene_type:complete
MPKKKNINSALKETYFHIRETKHSSETTLSGTDAARLVAGDWKDLYYEKKGIKDREDLSGVLPVQMGIYTEAFNREWYKKQTDLEVTDPVYVQSKSHENLVGSLDGLAYDSKADQLSIWDAKHTNAFMKADKLFEKYYPQMQHYMLVTELNNAILSVFYGNMKWEELHIAEDKDFQWSLLKAELMFLHMLENNTEPPDHMDWDNFRKEQYNGKGNVTISVLSELEKTGNE